jgi:hypothetical protein
MRLDKYLITEDERVDEFATASMIGSMDKSFNKGIGSAPKEKQATMKDLWNAFKKEMKKMVKG